ncbi:MAG: hypothetical protein PHH77_08955 [Victivallaceae bacterium]|nr:hypothetical protein [Victivallaceae bacterium]
MLLGSFTGKKNGAIDLSLIIFAGIRTETELVLNVQTSLDALVENLFAEMKKLLLNYGFIEYKERWRRHDFPIAVFLKLYLLLNGRSLQSLSLPCCLEYFRAITTNRISGFTPQ